MNDPKPNLPTNAERRRRTDSKLPLMQRRTAEYLAKHAEEPERWPLRMEDIARYVPCAVRLFYDDDPAAVALLGQIKAAKARPSENALAPSQSRAGDSLASVPDAAIARQVRQLLAQVRWTMQRYLGQHPEHELPDDAALAKFDLDTTVEHLRRLQPSLQAAVAEQQRRRGGLAAAATDQGCASPSSERPADGILELGFSPPGG